MGRFKLQLQSWNLTYTLLYILEQIMLEVIADLLVRIIGLVLLSTGPIWHYIPVRSAW